MLALTGENITESAVISITGMDDLPVQGVELAGPPIISSGYTNSLAVSVIARVNKMLPAGAEIPLKITVAQGGSVGVVSQVVMWKLRGFNELTSPGTYTLNTSTLQPAYSLVEIMGGLIVPANPPPTAVLIRSNSSLTIGSPTGPILVNGNGAVPGPGGWLGGAGTSNGSGPGAGQGFPAGLLTAGDGGGAGFSEAAGGTLAGPMAGEPFIIHYEQNRGSGGGGGAVALGGAGGAGGGGGGTIELSSLGITKVLGAISAKGGNGGGNRGSGGGGGSGGVIVVRGGIQVDAQLAFDVSGGTAPNGTNGGASGRIRIDGPDVLVTEATRSKALRGPTFPADFPATTDKQKLSFTLLGSPGANMEVIVSDIEQTAAAPKLVNFENASEATVTVELKLGYNRICASPVSTLSLSKAGSTSCVEIAYIRNYVPPKK